MILPSQIVPLHDYYQQHSPYQSTRSDYRTIQLWAGFLREEYSLADLKLVMNWLRFKISRNERRKESFRLYNLLDLEKFPYDLEDAKGWARRPQQTPKQKFLASVGRPEPEKENCRPVSELIQELRKTVR